MGGGAAAGTATGAERTERRRAVRRLGGGTVVGDGPDPEGLRRRTVMGMLATVPLLGALPLLQGCSLPGTGAGSGQAQGWLPAPAATPGSLLVVDLDGVALDTQVALAIMQGVINRRLKRGGQGLYLLLPTHNVGGAAQGPVGHWDADQRWLTEIAAQAPGFGRGVSRALASGRPISCVRHRRAV